MLPSLTYLRDLSRIAIPMGLQMLIFTSATTIDAIMVGQLGDRPLGAVGLADRASFLLAMITVGAANAAGTLGAQQLGAGDQAAFRRSIASGILVCGVLGLCSAIFFYFFSPWVVGLGSRDEELVRMGSGFLSIVGLSQASAGILLPLEVGLRCIQRAGVATLYSGIEALVNFCLNYALIFGNWGFPEMGVEGAAWGTLIARAVHVTLLVGHVVLWERRVAVTLGDLRAAWQGPRLQAFLDIALPLIVNHIIWGAGVFAFQLLYGRMGTAPLAAMTVIWTMQRLVLVQLASIGHAGAVLVGHAIGRGEPAVAKRLAWQNVSVAVGTSAIISLGLFLFRDVAIQAFSGLDHATVALILGVFPIFLVEAMLRSLTVSSIVGGLKAGGDVRSALWIDLAGAWFVGIPLAAAGAFLFGLPLPLVYGLAICEEGSKAVVALWRLSGTRWIRQLAFSSG